VLGYLCSHAGHLPGEGSGRDQHRRGMGPRDRPGGKHRPYRSACGKFHGCRRSAIHGGRLWLAERALRKRWLDRVLTPPSILATENLNHEIAAISGISANFSSGDAGHFSFYGIPPTVSAPADSPYTTAVGGVTLALNADNSIAWQAGWGNNQTLLATSQEFCGFGNRSNKCRELKGPRPWLCSSC
jgi:hypothetical protein